MNVRAHNLQSPRRMPFPAVRECRWLAPFVCIPKCLPGASPSTTTASTPDWSHMATCLLSRTKPKFTFASSGNITAAQLSQFFDSSSFLVLWTLPVSPIFLAGILNCFPSFPPNFLSPVPRMLLNLLQCVTLHSSFVLDCFPDPWIVASSFYVLTWMGPMDISS